MEIMVAFDRAYEGRPRDAVWIIDTPENRQWFEEHRWHLDPNSAVFDADAEPLTILRHVFDHHPNWSKIVVTGAGLTHELEEAVASDALVVREAAREFLLERP